MKHLVSIVKWGSAKVTTLSLYVTVERMFETTTVQPHLKIDRCRKFSLAGVSTLPNDGSPLNNAPDHKYHHFGEYFVFSFKADLI